MTSLSMIQTSKIFFIHLIAQWSMILSIEKEWTRKHCWTKELHPLVFTVFTSTLIENWKFSVVQIIVLAG